MWKSAKLHQNIEWWFIRGTNYLWKNGRWKIDSAPGKAAYSAQWKFINENYGPLQENIFWWYLLKAHHNANQDSVI